MCPLFRGSTGEGGREGGREKGREEERKCDVHVVRVEEQGQEMMKSDGGFCSFKFIS